MEACQETQEQSPPYNAITRVLGSASVTEETTVGDFWD